MTGRLLAAHVDIPRGDIYQPGNAGAGPSAGPEAGVRGARRVIFIDLTRALAALFMVYGHAIDALLAPAYRAGAWYTSWQFQRGLTSCLFLLLSGFAFSIATNRHWAVQHRLSPAVVKRVRRFGLFILLGYAQHVPVAPLSALATATAEQWRALFSVDVLHLIGVAFLGVQALVMVARSRRAVTIAALTLAVAIALGTPWVWSRDWSVVLPLPIAAYASTATGSQFPLFPWSAYVLLGVGLGQLYARWDAARLPQFANRVLLVPGAVLVTAWTLLDRYALTNLGTGPYNYVPAQLLLRSGVCLLILGAAAHAGHRVTRLPHVVGAVAQETLIIYFAHVCIVYGSIWNPGMASLVGSTLGPWGMLITVVLLVAAMALLASGWNRLKHARPRAARRVSIAAGLAMTARLV